MKTPREEAAGLHFKNFDFLYFLVLLTTIAYFVYEFKSNKRFDAYLKFDGMKALFFIILQKITFLKLTNRYHF